MITYEHLDLLPYVKRKFNKGGLYSLQKSGSNEKIWVKMLEIGQKDDKSASGNTQTNNANLLDELNKDKE